MERDSELLSFMVPQYRPVALHSKKKKDKTDEMVALTFTDDSVGLQDISLGQMLLGAPQQMEMGRGVELGERLLMEEDHLKMEACRSAVLKQVLAEVSGKDGGNMVYQIVDQKNKPLFLAQEDVNCCVECMPGSCKPYNFDVYARADEAGEAWEPMAHLYKPWSCPLFANRSMTVTDMKSGAALGTIKKPITCSQMSLSVHNSQNEAVLQVVGQRCDPGRVFGKMPIGCMSSIDFDIVSGKDKKIGSVRNVWGGFCNELFSDNDKFMIDFTIMPHARQRALMVAATIFLDMRFFQDKFNLRDTLLKRLTPMGYVSKAKKLADRAGMAKEAIEKVKPGLLNSN